MTLRSSPCSQNTQSLGTPNDTEWANRWLWCSALKQECSGCQIHTCRCLRNVVLMVRASGRLKPKDAQEPFVSCLIAASILLCSSEVLGASRSRHQNWMLIIHRLTGFIGDHFRLYWVQGTELHPMELRDEWNEIPALKSHTAIRMSLSTLCSQYFEQFKRPFDAVELVKFA